jgi:NDP-sugar pyrophosphorylase family protein
LKIDISEHTVEGETGEGFRLAISRFAKDEDFLAMNGDEITSLDLERLEAMHLKNEPIATIAAAPLRLLFGVLSLEGDDIVRFKDYLRLLVAKGQRTAHSVRCMVLLNGFDS